MAVLVAAAAAGMFLFLVVLPRRRERRAAVVAGSGGAEQVVIKTEPAAPPPAPRKRAPALANVPSLDDESVAQLLRVSPEDERPNVRSSSPGSGNLKRRTELRHRTTRDLQAGS